MELKFYICKHCKNLIVKLHDAGVPVTCCGEKMEELIPNTTDAATEKHVPVVSADDDLVTVTVGEVNHPMTQEHSIQWIILQDNNGYRVANLKPDQAPVATFALAEGDEVQAVYAYCNLHGLWKA